MQANLTKKVNLKYYQGLKSFLQKSYALILI